MRELSGRRPRVCATSVFSLRVCGNPLDRLVLDQRAGDLVTRRLPCQAREAGCRGALPYELLDVRRAIAVVPVPGVVGAIPFVGALWIRRPGRWTHPECLPGALEVVGGEAVSHSGLHGCHHLLGAQLVRPSHVPQSLSDDHMSLAAKLFDGVAFLVCQIVVASELDRESVRVLGGKLLEDS
jgi:hypothetical protein